MFAIVGRSCDISSYKVARKPLSVAGLFDSKDRIMTKPMLQPSFVAGPLDDAAEADGRADQRPRAYDGDVHGKDEPVGHRRSQHAL